MLKALFDENRICAYSQFNIMHISYRPIGIIHSPFLIPESTLIQASAAEGIKGSVEIFSEFVDGLKDLGGFSDIILSYHFNLSKDYDLLVKPFLDDTTLHGIFATRAPKRPNNIGISVVRLKGISNSTLKIEDVELFDIRKSERIGWFTERLRNRFIVNADSRFVNKQ